MSARAQHVFHEILARGFQAYPRGILNGFLFAGVTVAFVWSVVPHAFLLAWLVVGLGVALYRWSLAREFLRARPATAELDAWAGSNPALTLL